MSDEDWGLTVVMQTATVPELQAPMFSPHPEVSSILVKPVGEYLSGRPGICATKQRSEEERGSSVDTVARFFQGS